MKASRRMPYFWQTGIPMLRASVHADATGLPPWPGADADVGVWRGWLAGAWATRSVAEAVAIASPVLAGQIEATLAARPADAGQVRRMVLALARYGVRMRGRATPFGTFAGVAAARFGPAVSERWSDDHHVRARADALWLAHMIARLEACAPLRRRLSVVMNDRAVVRGDRLVVTWAPHGSVAGSENQVSVRLIPVLRTIMSLADAPQRTGDLVDKLSADYPAAPVEGLEALVGELMARGVLISSLRAPSTTTDAFAHLLNRLQEAGADDLPETHVLVADLQAIHHRLQESGCSASGARRRALRDTAARMHALAQAPDQPVAVDLRLGCTLVLPQVVADEASAAAEALIRLSPAPTGSASWREFHGRFLSQYGPGTPVLLEDLVDPVRGLGFPAHFAQPHREARELSPRDEALLALAQQAALDGVTAVALDEKQLSQLAGDGPRPVVPVDLWVDVRARSRAALDAGDFSLGVCGFGRPGAGTGRFLHLLDQPARAQAMDRYATMPTTVDGALAAQLCFPPQQARQENVQRVPGVLADVITLAEHRAPSTDRITVGDLAVAADQERLYVVSLSRRQIVEPVLPHAGARHTMPPLARLLLDIPHSAHPQVTSLDWGAAAGLPFLPRLSYGRSILAPAHWRLDPTELPGPGAPEPAWSAAFDQVRARLRLPANVAVGSEDRKLRLNLDKPLDRALFRAHLDGATGASTVAEAPTAADHGWFGGRAHEVVIPLAATAPPATAPAFLRGPVPPLAVSTPGKGVVYAKLYGPPETVDALVTEHVPRLLARWEHPPRWWFIRYHHPAPHLRLRLHDADTTRAAGRVAAWAEDLRERGLLRETGFDTYRPETGRYGGGAAMDAAEALFAADSVAVATQLDALSLSEALNPHALTAASLLDLAGAVTGSRPAGMRWLIDHPGLASDAPMSDREARWQTLQITDRQALHRVPGGNAIRAAWGARARAATRYAAALTPTITRRTPGSVLTVLLHLHHNRALGTDTAAEAITHKLARSAALAAAARHNTEPKGKEDT